MKPDLRKEHIDRANELTAQWFKEHKAIRTSLASPYGLSVEIITWQQPGTSNYGVQYMVNNNCVIVTGDLGSAIYCIGNRPLTLEMLPLYDWHYFVNKCVASETGRDYVEKIKGVSGTVPNYRAIAHYIGLQMALKQLLPEVK